MEVEITPSGKVRHVDCRNCESSGIPRLDQTPESDSLTIVQWNIERGYKLDGIIGELQRLNADIIGLQEVDVGCLRSSGKDTGLEIAKQLNLNYIFYSEFEELHSKEGGGCHGNAILTKYDIKHIDVVTHSHHPVDWNDPTHPLSIKEPRKGERAVLRVIVSSPLGPVVVYCAHFEVFCGMLSRITHLSDIFDDCRRMISEGYQYQVILGDLNTMAHGIARLSPKYCTDRMRWKSIGTDEGVMWEKHVLNCMEGRNNKKLLEWGLSEQVATSAMNPCFQCPFPAKTTVTFDNPSYRVLGGKFSLMKGKLDWMLLRSLHVVRTGLGNIDYKYSDHRLLFVEVKLFK